MNQIKCYLLWGSLSMLFLEIEKELSTVYFCYYYDFDSIHQLPNEFLKNEIMSWLKKEQAEELTFPQLLTHSNTNLRQLAKQFYQSANFLNWLQENKK